MKMEIFIIAFSLYCGVHMFSNFMLTLAFSVILDFVVLTSYCNLIRQHMFSFSGPFARIFVRIATLISISGKRAQSPEAQLITNKFQQILIPGDGFPCHSGFQS